MRYSRTGEGMHRFTDPADGETYVYTQLFMDDVQRVFAAFDQPDLKAVFELTVTAPAGLDRPRQRHHRAPPDDGRWQAAPTPPISTYLVAVAAGPWHSVTTEHAGLPFGIHCRRSLAPHLDADADEILDITRACFDRYHEKFDEPYPFDSYDQAFVPEFNAGAMENPGLVTFRDEFIYRSAVTDTERQTRAMVIAHEMAHMWFGDLVTLAWWDDIWLNESFAEYMGYQTLTEATRFTDTWTDFGVDRKAWGYDADQRPSTHPVAPDDASPTPPPPSSTSTASPTPRAPPPCASSSPGSARRTSSPASTPTSPATGSPTPPSPTSSTPSPPPPTATSTPGPTPGCAPPASTPSPRTSTEPTAAGTLTVDHARQPPPPHRRRPLRPRPRPTPAASPCANASTLDIPPDRHRQPIGNRPALLVLNDGDLTYAKVRLDPDSCETALHRLSGLPDPLTRAVVWNALRDIVRDGELAPAAYLDTARAHLPHETDLAIVQGVLAFAGTQIADRYLAPDSAPPPSPPSPPSCRDLIRRTEDGDHPGLRLIAVRHLIDVAAHPDTIAAWLADGTVPGGPELDPELRWRILARLAVLGAADEAAIAAELDRDPSATGQEGAARCRAALPDADAKARRLGTPCSTTTPSPTTSSPPPPKASGSPNRPTSSTTTSPATTTTPSPSPPAAAPPSPKPPAAGPSPPTPSTPTPSASASLPADADPIPALRRKLTDQLDDLRRALAVRNAH